MSKNVFGTLKYLIDLELLNKRVIWKKNITIIEL